MTDNLKNTIAGLVQTALTGVETAELLTDSKEADGALAVARAAVMELWDLVKAPVETGA